MNIYDTLANISRPIPNALISTKEQQGQKISYIGWADACDLMDERAPSWSSRVVREGFYEAERGAKGARVDKSLAYVVIEVSVVCDDGTITRSATGTDDEPEGQRGTPLDRAEAAGLRRAFSKFGLGRELYGGEGAKARQRIHAAKATSGNGPKVVEPPAETDNAPAAESAPIEYPPAPEHWQPEIENVAAAGKDAIRNMMAYIRAVETNAFRKSAALKMCYVELAKMAPTTKGLDWVGNAVIADAEVNQKDCKVVINMITARKADLAQADAGPAEVAA